MKRRARSASASASASAARGVHARAAFTRRGAFAGVVVAVALALVPAAAARADGVAVRVREASLGANGAARLVVQVTGADRTFGPQDFGITEAGAAAKDVKVSLLSPGSERGLAVALVLDVSGSTAGRPIADAKSAAAAFANGLPQGTRVEVVAFSDRARTVAGFTTDRGAVGRAVSSLAAKGGTALYDAIVLASSTLARTQALGNVVVFTDGADTASSAKLADAVSAARDAGAPVTVIELQTPDRDAVASRALAERTGGRRLDVAGSSGLQAAFGAAARDVASQYVVTYNAARAGGVRDVEVGVSVAGARDSVIALTPAASSGSAAAGAAAAAVATIARRSLLGGALGLWLGVGAAFAGLLVLFWTLLYRPRANVAVESLQRGLKVYARGGAPREAQQAADGFVRKVAAAADHLPRPRGWEHRLQATLDRAAWPLRASEFLGIQLGGAVLGAIVGDVLLAKWWLAIVLGGFAAAVPSLLLMRRISKRMTQLMTQLPDTLQLISGSLQAGYGFMQAIDTLVKEAPQPTASEFGRVLAEARLGMPVEDALESMAERLASEDLKWVVLAINIQRQVGGNLSSLLRTVAETLRERERVRRQIKVLSAEGKLSAYILGALPFGIAGYLMMVNPQFIKQLTGERLGRMMIGGAVVLMGAGIAWMRKVIRIEV
jgi:tight adherence protein B